MKNKLILLVALLIGTLAFLLNWRYLDQKKQELYKDAETVSVIVAKRDMPSMTVLTIEDLALNQVFKSAIGQNAFYEKDLDMLLGKRLLYPVRRSDPLLWSQVDMPRKTAAGLSQVVKKGMRAVSLAIGGAQAVSGLIQPLDRVDILGTLMVPSPANPKQMEYSTMTLMQNVKVLATGSRIGGQRDSGGSKSGYSSITFELTPEDVEKLVFYQQSRGQLYLSLRHPEDVRKVTNLPLINADSILSLIEE